jgi:hypothetical protein
MTIVERYNSNIFYVMFISKENILTKNLWSNNGVSSVVVFKSCFEKKLCGIFGDQFLKIVYQIFLSLIICLSII